MGFFSRKIYWKSETELENREFSGSKQNLSCFIMLTCQHDWCLITTVNKQIPPKSFYSLFSWLELLAYGVMRNCLQFTQWLLNLADHQVHLWNFRNFSVIISSNISSTLFSRFLLGFQLHTCLIIWYCLTAPGCSVLLPSYTFFLCLLVWVISISLPL